MNKRLFLLIVPVLLLASCQRENEWDGSPDIQATVEPEQKTRTSLSVDETGAGTIFWNPADQIDVFFGTVKASYTSQNTSDASTAVFKTNDSFSGSGFSSTDIWGLYPSNSSSCCDGNAITTTLPSSQLGVPGSFDDDLFLAVAHSSTTSLQFYNVCGGIKFNLAFDDIKKITFRGNNNEDIAGTVSISFVDGLPKATIVNGVKEITLTPKTGATFTKGSDYYFTILPCTLSEGFTMEFTTEDGSIAFFDYSESSVTIKRSVFGKKGNLDVYASFGDERQPNNVIYYTNTYGQVLNPVHADVFGANIVSNEYVGGRGIITFDGDVTSIGTHAFDNLRLLTSIKIPKSVTSIGSGAFVGCTGLTSIEIPNSVTVIEDSAFWGCSGLTSIEIPGSVTSIGSNPIAGCSALMSIIVENSNPSYDSRNNCNAIINSSTNELVSGCKNTVIPRSVTSIGNYAFYDCSGLISIEIPKTVSSIGYCAFRDCSSLISIEIPNSVTSIGSNPFTGCKGLVSIIVENANPKYDSRDDCNAIIYSEMNMMVSGCKNTVIPNSVTRIGSDAFQDCIGLTSIEIPNSVTSIDDYAFERCSGLTSIEIPDSVTSISSHAFSGCSGLTLISVYAFLPPQLYGGGVFGMTNGCPIYVPAVSVESYKSAWSEYTDRIQAFPQPNNVIYYTSSDEQVVTPNAIDAFGATIVSNEYLDGKGVIIFDGDVTIIGMGAFSSCSRLTTIDIPYSVTSIGQAAFHGCTSLKTIAIPASVTSFGYGNPFGQCPALTTIFVDPDNPVFDSRDNCNAIIRSQDHELVSGCKNTIIPGSVQKIGISAFSSCTGMTSIEIPDSVTRIGAGAFAGCTGLVSVTIPNSVTSIESEAFLGCTGFTSLYIPDSVMSIASYAFNNCSGLTSIRVYALTPPSLGDGPFSGTNSCPIYVYPVCVETYKATWLEYADRIYTMGDYFDAVDLGLSVKWATCNIGALTPEEYGDYFAWGETSPKNEYSWSNYKFRLSGDAYNNVQFSKYNCTEGRGIVDNKTELDLSDDAAHENWGGGWRMPTYDEAWELIDNCVFVETTYNGIQGVLITGKNGNSIFLPAAGDRWDANPPSYDAGCFYWTASLCLYDGPRCAYDLYHYRGSSYLGCSNYGRVVGLPIRPVRK